MKFLNVADYFSKPYPVVNARPVHCLFYSHIWSVYSLADLGLIKPKTDVIIELATEPTFATMLNPFNAYQETLLSLLQPNKHLHHLGAKYKGIPVPMVLAPPAGTSANALLSALALVNTDASSVENVVVMININDAAKFVSAYGFMTRFSLVWDVADYPNASLAALAELLVTEAYLDEQRWGGIHLCNHPQRQLPDSKERFTALQALFADFPSFQSV
ncbi:hypothetical protein JCM14076_08040 [Methylosoma difficile]